MNGLRLKAAVLLFCAACFDPAHAIDPDRFSINGFTSMEIDYQVDEIGEGNPNISFDADLFDLLMNFQIGEKMRAAVDLSWEHGSEERNRYGSTNLEYAFIEHTLIDEIKFRIGKILTPFGVFNEIHRAKPAFLTVNVPFSTSDPVRYAPLGFEFFPRAGAGLSIQGDAAFEYSRMLEYNLFIANGIQDTLNPYEQDGNQSKSVTARVRFDVFKGLRAGMSVYLDKPSLKGFQDKFSSGYDLEITRGNFQLLFEQVAGYQVYSGDSLGSGDSTAVQTGLFIQPSYHLNIGLTPYVRAEYFSPDMRRGDNFSVLLLGGLMYEISPWYMVKCEGDYYHFGKQSGVPSVPGDGFTEIRFSLVLGF